MSTNIQGSLPDYPLVYAEEPRIRLAIVYNPFDLTSTAKHELVYGQSKTLADYMDGLPEEVEWNVAYNGELVDQADWATVKPAPFSNITIVRVPEGGGGNSGKNILRIVALIAVMTFAAWAGPALVGAMGIGTAATATAAASTSFTLAANAASAAIGVAGSMAVNMLLAPKAPTPEKVSTAYGVDGAKNSAREGVVVPVTYGDFRVGGNVSDLFTRNFGEDQYLYVRTIMNDGEVEDITDIELNGQPLSSFTDVQTRIRKGEMTQEANDWFDETVRQFNRNAVLTTDWIQHVTDGQVDRLRADVAFPGGLYFAKDDGRKIIATVNLELQYSPVAANGQPTGAWANLPLSGGEGLTVSDFSSRTKRLTYESTNLPRARYAIRIRRSTPDDETDKRTDACYITDFGEIENQPTNVNGTANLSLRVKMTDQLSGIPTVTALVKGSKVNIYDEDGNVTGFQKSANPADIVADLLFNPTRGAEYAPSKMVWPRYVEFREHCVQEGYEFNGVFDSVESLWDVAQSVAARGHGTLLPRGTKFTFVIDRAQAHEMVFTPGNIYKDTFKTTWVSTAERANEIQLVFFDKEQGNKQRTIRVVDNVAFARGDKSKVASASGLGISTVEEAIREAEFAARVNRYIKKMIEFDAPIEAIGLNIGDVALVQHNSMDFKGGLGGRLAGGSTTTSVTLDADATMVAGKTYSLILVESAIKRYDATITAISGSRITVTGIPDGPARIRRLIKGDVDVEVLGYTKIGSTWRVTVADETGLTAGACELWDTDVIEERDVVTVAGSTRTLQLATPLAQAPSQYANFMFGEKVAVKKPFRLKSISGNDVDRRTLGFVQYDERIYQRGGFDTIEVDIPTVTAIPHVTGLTVGFDRNAQVNQERLPVTVTWQKPSDPTHAGADVYYDTGPIANIANSRWKTLGQVFDISTYERDFQRNETVRFKVVAFNDKGQRAPFATAPTFQTVVEVYDRDLKPPTDVTYSVPLFSGTATARLTWTRPADDFPSSYRVEAVKITQVQANALQAAIDNPVYFAPTQVDDIPEYRVVVPAEILALEGYQTASTTTETVDVPNLDAGYVAFRVRSENAVTVSEWTWVAAQIEAVPLPLVTNIKLNGVSNGTQFSGLDASFTWDDVVDTVNAPVPNGQTAPDRNIATVWKDYQVEIYSGASLIRREFTRNPAWSYTFDKNATDTAGAGGARARRSFRFVLKARGLQGQLSGPVEINATNAAPALLPVVATPLNLSARLTFQAPNDTDFGGIIVWASSTTGFTPSAGNIVYQGNGTASWALPQTGPSFYRYAFYDLFDQTTITVSAEASITATGITAEADLTTIEGRLGDIDIGLAGVPGLIAAADADLQAAIEAPTSYLVGRLSSIDRQIAITNPEAGSLGARFLAYEGKDANGITRLQGLENVIGASDGGASVFSRLVTVEDIFKNPDGSISAARIQNIEQDLNTPMTGIKARISSLTDLTSGPTFVRATQLDSINTAISQRARTFMQSTEPTGIIDNVAVATGDLWINTGDSNKLNRYNGTSWVPFTTPATRTYAQDTQPVGNVDGDLWFETDVSNRQWRYNGTSWVLVQVPGSTTYAQTSQPAGTTAVPLKAGDLWVDTDDNNALYRYDGTGWVNLRSAGTRTFAQNDAPGQPLYIGDIWIDTDDNNKLNRWSGSGWFPYQDPRVGTMFGTYAQSIQDIADLKTGKQSVSAATILESKVNLKNRTFAQSTAPVSPVDNVALVFGDLWMDTSDGNKIYRWVGTGWQYQDNGGAAALAELVAARGGSPTLSARFGSFTGTVADALNGKASVTEFDLLESEVTNARNGAGSLSARLTLIDSSLDGKATASQLTTLTTRVDQKARTFMQGTQPANPSNNLALAVGDLWIDTDDYSYHRYNGTSWVPFTTPTTKTYAQPNQPTGQVDGDLWFDTDDNNRQYRYNGVSWVAVQKPGTTSYAQPNPPGAAGLVEGDLWCDTDANNKIHRWNGSAWVDIQAAAARSFAQPNEPGQPLSIGDMWFDTDDFNKLHRWSGSTWAEVEDARVGQLSTDFTTFKQGVTDIFAGTATATVFDNIGSSIRLRNRSFAQNDPPATVMDGQALSIGDLWMDTNDNNRIKRWAGAANGGWVDIHDARGETALGELAAARGAYASLSARFGTFTGTLTDALNGKASVTRVETMEAKIDGPEGQPELGLVSKVEFARSTAVTADGRASAIIGLTSNANGVVTGFTSVNPGPGRNMTEFKVQSDKFSIVPSGVGSSFEFRNGLMEVKASNGQPVFQLTW